MQLSVIIPTLNEAENIERLVRHIWQHADQRLLEVLVVDSGSTDNTANIARKAGAKVLERKRKGRAYQMNEGAKAAAGDNLYIIHGDTLPHPAYLDKIEEAFEEGYPMGCFRSYFDSSNPLLKINGYFSRFDRPWCRGGDQTFFIKKEIFEEFGGYKSELLIMEEYDFLKRSRKKYPFKIVPAEVIISARKYETNSFLRVQIANMVVWNMFRFGSSQQAMVNMYKKLLNYR